MNDNTNEKLQQALKQTQAQAEEAAQQLGGLLRKGADKLKEAAEKAGEAIRNDINNHPE